MQKTLICTVSSMAVLVEEGIFDDADGPEICEGVLIQILVSTNAALFTPR